MTPITTPKNIEILNFEPQKKDPSLRMYENIRAPPPPWGGTSFVNLLCFFCLVFVMPLCASVYLCIVVICWERADLLALVCGV